MNQIDPETLCEQLEYRCPPGKGSWRRVTSTWKIAKIPFGRLGRSWFANREWRLAVDE